VHGHGGLRRAMQELIEQTTDPATTGVTCTIPLLREILEIVDKLKFSFFIYSCFPSKEETTEQCRVPFGPTF
jgi:hypothetical protein